MNRWDLLIYISLTLWGFYIGTKWHSNPSCPETLPDKYSEAFTIRNDTLFIQQGVDFTISTKTMTLDTAGIIYRNR
jgi:hypothetical protein